MLEMGDRNTSTDASVWRCGWWVCEYGMDFFGNGVEVYRTIDLLYYTEEGNGSRGRTS